MNATAAPPGLPVRRPWLHNGLLEAELCVIGAGSGGLSVAAGAVQMRASVVLVEKHLMGGDCLNTGGVPSKALLAAAHAAQEVRSSGRFGVNGHEPSIDFAKVHAHVHGVIAAIAPHDSVERFGNALACLLIRLVRRVRYTDLGPFRVIRRDALARLGMRDETSGWTVEMQVRAARLGQRVREVSVRYRRRIGTSKISGTLSGTLSGTVRAGWKILRVISGRRRWMGSEPHVDRSRARNLAEASDEWGEPCHRNEEHHPVHP